MSAVPTTPAGKRKIVVKTTVLSYGLLIRHLMTHDVGVNDLLEITGLHRQTIGNILRAFHKLDIIHVCKWLPDRAGRHNIPVYRWDIGIDVKRPRLTGAERQQRQRNKRKQQRESTKQRDLAAIEKGLKSELAKLRSADEQKPATSAGLGYSVFVQADLGLDRPSS